MNPLLHFCTGLLSQLQRKKARNRRLHYGGQSRWFFMKRLRPVRSAPDLPCAYENCMGRRFLTASMSSYAAARLRGVRRERPVVPTEAVATASKLRNASFTASLFVNALVNAGSITTTFVAFAYRAAYLPRTNGPKPAREYSARNSSSLLLPFFINSFLFASCRTGADDPDDAVLSFIGISLDWIPFKFHNWSFRTYVLMTGPQPIAAKLPPAGLGPCR